MLAIAHGPARELGPKLYRINALDPTAPAVEEAGTDFALPENYYAA